MTFRLFKNDVTRIFWLSIFSVKFVGWEQDWAQYFMPLARSQFSTQWNIYERAFFYESSEQLKTVNFREKSLPCDVRPGSKYASL